MAAANEPGPSKNANGEDKERDERTFECNICLDTARDAVVSMCGHLFWYDILKALIILLQFLIILILRVLYILNPRLLLVNTFSLVSQTMVKPLSNV